MHPIASTLCAVSLLAASVTPVEEPAAAPNVVGKSFRKARALLIAAGWEPRVTYMVAREEDSGEKTYEHSFADARVLYKEGIVEVESCAGTGSSPCIFNYLRGETCLRIYTQWEGNPEVVEQTNECPDPAIVEKPADYEAKTASQQ